MAAVASSMPLGGQSEGELRACQQAELGELEERLQEVALGSERLSDRMKQMNLGVAQVRPPLQDLPSRTSTDLHRPPLLPHSRTPPPAPSFTLFHSCLTPPHPHLLQPWSRLHLHTSPPFLHLPAVVCVA